MWWLVVSLILIAFLVWSEVKSQDCLDSPCLNSTPEVSAEDDKDSAVEKLIVTSRKNHLLVAWRRALLLALISAVFFLFIFRGFCGTGRQFFILALILFIIFYAALEVPQKNHWKPRDLILEHDLLRLGTE